VGAVKAVGSREGNWRRFQSPYLNSRDSLSHLNYWFMHYNQTGMPTIPLSAIFGKADLEEMSRLIASLVP